MHSTKCPALQLTNENNFVSRAILLSMHQRVDANGHGLCFLASSSPYPTSTYLPDVCLPACLPVPSTGPAQLLLLLPTHIHT